MNAAIKAKWVAALRSGEYEQTQGALCKDGAFCCLGVLSDLYIKETGRGEWVRYGGADSIFIEENYKEDCNELPAPVMQWAGITDSAPVARTPGHLSDKYDLIGMNDAGMPFPTIADIIEAYL